MLSYEMDSGGNLNVNKTGASHDGVQSSRNKQSKWTAPQKGARSKAGSTPEGSESSASHKHLGQYNVTAANNNDHSKRLFFYQDWSDKDYRALVDTFGTESLNQKSPQDLFFESIRKDRTDLVRAFLKSGWISSNETHPDGESPLTFALTCGSMNSIKVLLDQKDIDVNKLDGGGDMPLIIAMRCEDLAFF